MNIDPQRYKGLLEHIQRDDIKFILSLGAGVVPALVANFTLVKILEELGAMKYCKAIWGTSAGAVVGGIYASGQTLDTMDRVLGNLSLLKILDPAVFHVLRGALTPEVIWGLHLGKLVEKMLDGTLYNKNFEDTYIKFRCIATKINPFFEKTVFSNGNLRDAIRASMNIPFIFVPKEKDGIQYVDGAVVEKVPCLSILEDERQTEEKLFILAAYCGYPGKKKIGSGIEMATNALDYLQHAQYKTQIELTGQRLASDNVDYPNGQVAVLAPMLYDVGSYDFSREAEITARCEHFYLEQLEQIGLGL